MYIIRYSTGLPQATVRSSIVQRAAGQASWVIKSKNFSLEMSPDLGRRLGNFGALQQTKLFPLFCCIWLCKDHVGD